MKPSALRIERLLAKVEATLVPPPRKWLRGIIDGDDEAEAKEKALAEHVARHSEDVGRTVFAGGRSCGSGDRRARLRQLRRKGASTLARRSHAWPHCAGRAQSTMRTHGPQLEAIGRGAALLFQYRLRDYARRIRP